MKKLTIAIPTYNRSHYLKQLLISLLEQVTSNPMVEVIVLDNASTDDTSAIIAELHAQGHKFRYIVNPENLGASRNIYRCFMESGGTYLWVIGDDDYVVPGAIDRILGHVENAEYDLIYLQHFSFEGDPHLYKKSSYPSPLETTSSVVFVREVNIHLTFISGNIVNKDRILSIGKLELDGIIESYLVQLGWIYASLNIFARGLYIREPLIGMRVNNTGGYKLFNTFGPVLRHITETRLHDQRLQQLVINGIIQRFWPYMIRYVKDYSPPFIEESSSAVLGKAFRDKWRYWIFVYPVLHLHRRLITPWLFLLRAINAIDCIIGRMLLR